MRFEMRANGLVLRMCSMPQIRRPVVDAYPQALRETQLYLRGSYESMCCEAPTIGMAFGARRSK